MASRPTIGGLELLVYRECQHGCWCATGEGALHPRCPEHGLLMLPGGGPEGMYDNPGDRRLGFVAFFGQEKALAGLRCRVRMLLGLYGPHSHAMPGPGRYFHDAEIAGMAEAVERAPRL